MKDNPLIILLTDFSEASYEAFEPAVELAKRLNARISLVHMVQDLMVVAHGAPLAPAMSMPPQGIDALKKRAQHEMETALTLLGTDVPVNSQVLVGERVHEVVGNYASENGADFVSMATHGRSGLRRALMGSVAEAILRHTKIPVLIFPLSTD
jgi:nucleotide-binding universal stress UspA family protein